MKTKLAIIGLAALLAAGCLAPASKINGVSIGMTKAQALQVMGQPVSVTSDGHAEFLNYALAEGDRDWGGALTPYEIKMVDGKVAAYGRAGSPTAGAPAPVIMPVVR